MFGCTKWAAGHLKVLEAAVGLHNGGGTLRWENQDTQSQET